MEIENKNGYRCFFHPVLAILKAEISLPIGQKPRVGCLGLVRPRRQKSDVGRIKQKKK